MGEVVEKINADNSVKRKDLVIEPGTKKVIPNPRSPETPMIEIFMTTSP